MPLMESIQYVFFAFVAASCVPVSTLLLIFNLLWLSLSPWTSIHQRLKRVPGFRSRTIFITGVNTPHGLRLARAFHSTGHKVIGADHEPDGFPIHVRFSKALSRFYRLPPKSDDSREVAYIESLVRIIDQEHAELWINCTSSVDPSTEAQARSVIEQRNKCQCFALRINDVPYFATREAFLLYTASQGLPVPETYHVKSRDEVHNVLNKARGRRKYLLQSLDQNGVYANSARTVLPRRTLSQTYNTVSQMAITSTVPWKLEQDVNELERYHTFAIIVKGSLRAFVASRLIHPGCYQLLEPKSALNMSMLRFVHTFARNQGHDFTTHLGIDFCVEEQFTESGVAQIILPVQVSIQAQAAAQLFQGLSGSVQLSRAYLDCLNVNGVNAEKQMTKSGPAAIQHSPHDDIAMPDSKISGTYSFGQDLLQLFFEPLLKLITLRIGIIDYTRHLVHFLKHLVFWEDDLYNFQDPMPFWWSYQIYIPLRFVRNAVSLDA
ncbi:uncharacterized protein Z520_08081 [Fonsecaea multimorphosa CBS 102226]|uniref:Uncharacterized protein n=1 Tax=Fonsecaea multimorphosa CBS 102226 TaxID=1442371 RepID=A0A0D2KI20_9EURO|nr:uncharacterized protein Z520_08081 [Fonsecaea multimorphosa CBS 102226]KIX96303.1 hypothetical protein Z520_08081 [Fonsecaea multimorphosa CBS 102226]OAL21964.1 hypothetical protein AYO22_07561 [Fonsecaea multimorphosa]